MRLENTKIQSLLDQAVADGVAPGLQFVVFDEDSVLFNGVSGHSLVPSEQAPDGDAYRPEHAGWLASCSKITISLIVLHILERGLTKFGFTLDHLDSHQALAQVVPEFRHGSGSLVTKIIDGFEDHLGPDSKKVMKLRDANRKTTLRMLLTHSAGAAYWWSHPYIAELYEPGDGSVPHKTLASASGAVSDYEVPLVAEPGTSFTYGHAADWLGQFAIRSTGRSLRSLFQEILFNPLSIASSELDICVSPSMSPVFRPLHVRNPETKSRTPSSRFLSIDSVIYNTHAEPPEGKAHYAGGCAFGSAQGFAKILQAVLRRDRRILSEETWAMACADDFARRGLKVPTPVYKTTASIFSNDIPEFAKSSRKEGGAGVNLLQCSVATVPTLSGRPAGSFGWAGLANTYYFIDHSNGIGAIVNSQLMPFFDPKIIETRDRLEKLIYDNLNSSADSPRIENSVMSNVLHYGKRVAVALIIVFLIYVRW